MRATRLALWSAALVIGIGCGARSTPLEANRAPVLQLTGNDAELWTFDTEVSGVVRGNAQLVSCVIQVGTSSIAAKAERTNFRARVNLSAGSNTLRARCLTRAGAELRSQELHYQVRLNAKPVARASIRILEASLQLDARRSTESESEPAALSEYAWFEDDGAGTTSPLGLGALLDIAKPNEPGMHRYALRVTDARGRGDLVHVAVNVARDEVLEVASTSTWLAASVVYGVLPPLFGPAGLPNVTAALDALMDLGVNVLWMAPLFDAPAGDFGYAVNDYFRVRASYGGDAALAQLVAQAHRRGLRVVLDLPANHTAREHRYFAEATRLGTASHYHSFYARDERGRALHYFDWAHLPNLNYRNAEVTRMMLEVGTFWVQRYGADGYRIDAAWGVRDRNPQFWPQFRAAMSRICPDVFLLAEASARDPYYQQGGFDAAYDWTEQLGRHAWEDVFSSATGIARRLDAAVAETTRATPDPRGVLRFLNNNDTARRFITKHGEGLTRVATAALLTLPGLPALYSFDEVGAEFEPYGKLTPVRKQNQSLRDFHKRWIGLRRTHPALAGADFEALPPDASNEVYAFVRGRERPLLVVLNFSGARASSSLNIRPGSFRGARLSDLLTGQVFEIVNGTLRIELSGWQALALEALE